MDINVQKMKSFAANTSDHLREYDMFADERKCGIYLVAQAESLF